MIQKRFFALLCTAVMTITCIVPLHAAAENDTTPAAETGTAQEEQTYFIPGSEWEKYGTIYCRMRVEKFEKENTFGGILATFSDPDLNLFIISNYNGWHPRSSEYNLIGKIKGTMANKFDVFVFEADPEHGYPVKECWCAPDGSYPTDQKFTLDLSGMLEQMQEFGLSLGKLQKLETFCATPAEHELKFETPDMIRMEPDIAHRSPDPDPADPADTDTIRNMLKPYFKIGKSMIMEDAGFAGTETQNKDYLRVNYHIASLEYRASSDYLLSGTWKPGDPIKADLGSVAKFLETCENYNIPVAVGPFVSRHLPDTYYKDESGSYAEPEEMNQRFDQIFDSFFTQLKEKYPNLRVEYVIVTSDVINKYPGSNTDPLGEIYGQSTDEFLSEVFKSARTYAPADAKLYMEEFLYPQKDSMKQVSETASAFVKNSGCMDGIAVSLTVGSKDSWLEESVFFDEAMDELAKTELDLILSDVCVYSRPAYFDDIRCEAFTEGFSSFLSHADQISAVLLNDREQALDGPHPLGSIKDLNAAIKAALPEQEPVNSEKRPGDVNCDNTVDISDAVLLARYVAEEQTAVITADGRRNADADGNAKIESDDVIYILRMIAKLI